MMAKKINKDSETLNIIQNLVISQAYIESLDGLEETSLYRQSNKNLINKCRNVLIKTLQFKFKEIYKRDEKSYMNSIESFEIIGKWAGKADLEDVYALAQAIKNNQLKFVENEK